MPRPRSSLRYPYVHNSRIPIGAQPLTSLLVLLVAFFFPDFSFAQSTATLSGTVEDQAGAVIAGADIALINASQGSQRLTTSDSEGKFIFPLVPAGKYSLSATKEGFAPVNLKELILNVNDQISQRIVLIVGAVTQTVDVESTSLIDQSPSVSTLVDQQFIGNLPLNGRSFQSLIALTPGFVLTSTNTDNQGQFSVNGQRANANYFMIDGVGANIGVSPSTNTAANTAGTTPGFAATGGTNNLVSVDALQEFKVLTSTFAPEFGRTPGAQVQILTRSGTNEFHGTAFEYFRNEALDAADWFRNATRQPRVPLRQHDFGGVLGGPLYLPRFGEGGPALINSKRTFFFFSYEGLRLRLPQTTPAVAVPSVNARAIAPPGIRELVQAFPMPNGRELGNNLAEFSASYSDPSRLDATSLRVDHLVNDRFSFFVRYNHSPSEATTRNGLSQVSNSAFETQTLTGGATAIFSPTLTNDFRANYSRNRGDSVFTLDNFGGAIPPPDSLLFSGFGSADRATVVVSLGAQSFLRGTFGVDIQRQINLLDTLSVIKGDHQLKFGVDYRRLIPIFDRPNYSQQIIFGSLTSAITTARTSLAFVNAYFGPVYPVFNNLSVFAQDTWRINSRLTLTYGSRWELNPPPTEATGNEPVTLTGLHSPATMTLAPAGTPLYKTRYNNFAPRIGFAYQLSQGAGRETVLRGGVGIFYDMGTGPVGTAFSIGFPYFRQKPLGSVPYPLSTAGATPPPPFPESPVGALGNALGVIDPDFELPYTYQWNLGLERSLGAHQTVTSSYVGAVGRRLLRQEFISSPNPTFGSVRLTRNSATSDYHAFQLQFQRRLARGLQALGSYTWSHSLDNVSLDTSSEAPSFNIDVSNERGPSDFDVRHAVTGALTYDIPTVGQNRHVSALIRNFSLDGTFTARTATPINVVTGTNIIGGNQMSRPDLVAGVPLYLDDESAPGGWRINRAAFTVPVGRQGTLGRNALRGFPLWQLDLALRRQFRLTEGVNLQLRGEVFNLFNHPNFAFSDPVRRVNNQQFGRADRMLGRFLGSGGANGGFNPLYQVGGPRSIQLAMKLLF
ncbi:MAG TPA: TonB-dependent receptor [Pyrinomonadaceae bacterium]|nr:TonB-dependent receptor [Pyrinomonadaceae bacterium]